MAKNLTKIAPLTLLMLALCSCATTAPTSTAPVASAVSLAKPATPAPLRGVVVDGIAATVNEEPITTAEVDKEYQVLQQEMERLPPMERIGTKADALSRLVDKKLLDQKIRELDIKIPDEEVRATIDDVKRQNHLTQEALVQALAAQGLSYDTYKAQIRDQLERMRLMSQEVRDKVQVGETEMRAYYDANRQKFGAEEMFHARHIFFKADKKGDAEVLARTEALANDVLKQAKAGKDFAALAKKYSTDPAAAKDGGDLGTFKKDDMLPEIANTVAAMKPGDISPIVMSPVGLHIIKLETRFQSPGKPFEEVKGQIEDTLYKKKTDDRFNQWAKDLRKSAAIDIRKEQ
jgi:peptidyl-prolyl cis-trans isomerase SurA